MSDLGFERVSAAVVLIDGKHYRLMSDAEVAEFVWDVEHAVPIACPKCQTAQWGQPPKGMRICANCGVVFEYTIDAVVPEKVRRQCPNAVAIVHWFKNGDHPQDNCHMVHPDPRSVTQFVPFLSEGEAVRYFRHPEIKGSAICIVCFASMDAHGWIEDSEQPGGGYVVCPGDWIATDANGSLHPYKG